MIWFCGSLAKGYPQPQPHGVVVHGGNVASLSETRRTLYTPDPISADQLQVDPVYDYYRQKRANTHVVSDAPKDPEVGHAIDVANRWRDAIPSLRTTAVQFRAPRLNGVRHG